MSLQKLYANLFHQKISKRQRLSNWESPILDAKQKEYASIDAWACIKIYDEIEKLKLTGNYELVDIPDEEMPDRIHLSEPANTLEEPQKCKLQRGRKRALNKKDTK